MHRTVPECRTLLCGKEFRAVNHGHDATAFGQRQKKNSPFSRDAGAQWLRKNLFYFSLTRHIIRAFRDSDVKARDEGLTVARKKSLLEDFFETLSSVPWWAGVISAVIIKIVGSIMLAGMAKNQFQNALSPLLSMFFNVLAILALVAAAVSFIKGLMRKSLLNRQTGLASLNTLSWREFEQLVGEAFRRQGYVVEETGGGGADGGVDLVLRGHGETVLVQCKQWRERQVGVDKVRELFGVVTAERATRGILVTSGCYTNDAQSFKVGKPLVLIDGPALAQLVRDAQPTAPTPAPAPVMPPAQTSPVCPRCGSPMALRTARRGANAGTSFYGCTRYPACQGTRPTT